MLWQSATNNPNTGGHIKIFIGQQVILKLEHIIDTKAIVAGRVRSVNSDTGIVTVDLITSKETIQLPYDMLYYLSTLDPAREYGLPT